ncbi:MAG: PKD domain-containing protein [Planctomycetes bacterium]|nr:PKD domain-containing protein [Planctomycetota bacterium]
MNMRASFLSALSMTLLALCGAQANAQGGSTQTLPVGFETREGNGSTSFPLNTSGTHRWHWVYDSAQFLATGPIAITQIDLRPDGGLASWGPAIFSNFELRLGAATNDYRFGNYDANFDANWAPGTSSPHAFFAGALVVPAGVGGASPSPWSVVIQGAPFVYDPSLGRDLIVEVRTPGAGAGNPLLHSLDGASAPSGTNGGNRYGNTSSAFASVATFASNEFVPVVRVHYQPASGLFAAFSAGPRSGASPLAVSFTDRSFSSDPAGIQAWAWDFDGDGVVDSNSQFPSFTYASCGSYDVKLTVFDTLHPPSTLSRSSYIQVDPQNVLAPNFTSAPIGPLALVFTDASLGNPVSWDWDLDGNGTIDSTAQSPVFVYTAPGPYTAILRVTNGCGSAAISRVVYALRNDECAQALPLIAGTNGPFDSRGATTSLTWPCAFAGADLWFSYTASCSGSLRIDTCANPAFDTVLALWSGTCGALTPVACRDDGCGLQSQIDLPSVVAGDHFWISVGGFQGAQGTFFLAVEERAAGSGGFAPAFPACGAAGLVVSGNPNVGGDVRFDLVGVQGTPFVNVGLYSLGVPICAAGCVLGATLEGTYPGAIFAAPIPCDPTLRGAVFYAQGFDLGASGGCAVNDPVQIALSNTWRVTIG